MNPLPSVAIVILNWNGRKFLEKFLPSVMASIYPNKKIIIADNGSTDDSVAFLNQSYPTIEILQNSSNEGFAGGYNTALKQVTADYYVLLNSDVEVTENWIGHVIELMESNERIAACQPKMPAHLVAGSINMAIHSTGEEYLMNVKKIMGNTTTHSLAFGPRGQPCLLRQKYIMN